MSDYIQERDKLFQNDIETIEAKEKGKKRRKTRCVYPECDDKVDSKAKLLGMCNKHRARHYSGTLLTLDPSAFPIEEMLELYKDVFAFAEELNVDVSVAVTWLISEGLNSYERRVKK